VKVIKGETRNYVFENIDPGRYTIQESDQPEGCDTIGVINVTVTTENEILIDYNAKAGLDGASACIQLANPVSGVSGYLVLDYPFMMANNVLNNSFTFTKKYIRWDGCEISADNTKTLRYQGEEYDFAKLCENTSFSISEMDGENHGKSFKDATIKSNNDGVWTVKDLPDGTYYIHEEKTLAVFKPAADIKLDVVNGKITASYVTCPNDSSRTPVTSDFTGLSGNGGANVSAVLYNNYNSESNSLTIKKTYYDADGNPIPYSKLGSSTAKFEL
jgi:hypothetical protein